MGAAAENQLVDVSLFADLVPVKALSPDHCQELANKSVITNFTKGKILFRQGEASDVIIYVLSGEVELSSSHGHSKRISGGSKASKLPLEQNRTHQFTAVTHSEVTCLSVDPNLLDIMLTWEQSGGYEVQEIEGDGGDDDDDWMSRILQAQVFHRIPPANIQSIFMKMEPNHYEAGDTVIKQGAEGEHFYIIREGSCKVVRKTRKNPEGVTLAKLNVGDNFGEEALISGGKRNASVIMLTSGVLMSLSKKDFLELMNEPLLHWKSFEDAKSMVDQDAEWIDVRLPAEYQTRHLPDSINIPLPILRSRLASLDPGKSYIVCCDTGRRSSTATYLLTQNGFKAYVLENGLQHVDPEQLLS